MTSTIPNWAEKIDYAAAALKAVVAMPETPAVLRGYLSPDEGVALMLLAAHGPGEGAIVEIGSFLGKSTCWLALGARAGKREKVTAIDYFRPLSFMATSEDPMDQAIAKAGSTFPFFQEHLARFGVTDQVEPLVASSLEAVAQWDGRPIRFLFIDGHHEYESVKQDFEAWSPFVIPGGVIAFHDYQPNWPGVIRFYDEAIAPAPGFTELFQSYSMKVVLKH